MRFLIVDDDESIILFLRTFLSAYAECLTAGDGLEALAAFEASLEEERPITAVFMDILMPGMDGNEVVQALRRMEDAAGPRQTFKLIMSSVLTDTKNV
uniref:response regulator n=1 Tax=Solidesulfovibrio sp. TaxID=2910990 RepID=UPI00262C774F